MELTYAREMKTCLSGGIIKLDPHAEDWGSHSVGITNQVSLARASSCN